MKYIRTKDFVHDSKDVVIVNENGTLVVLRGIDKDFVERTHGRTWNTGTNVVIAQADAIEELCDEFDIIVKGKHHHYYNMEQVNWVIDQIKEERVYINDETIEKVDAIYGAIWTDKGLIYVAKMNEKGELELL